MDNLDYRILHYLESNARENATTIGAKINLSASAVIERIRKMENAGVILQYTVLLDQKKLDRTLTAFINVRLDHPKYYESFVEVIKSNEAVAECHYIAGDFDFLLKVVIAADSTLETVLNSVKSINGVSLTRTTVVLSTNKYEVCLLKE